MIKIIYVADPEGGKLTMRAEGHAGYAPAGQDIVCAAVSCLMQTLAYSAAEDERTSSCIYGQPADGKRKRRSPQDRESGGKAGGSVFDFEG